MNKSVAFIFSLFSLLSAYSQQKNDVNSDALLKSLSQNACKCIDSVKIVERSKSQISHDIHECIKSEVSAYQLGSKLFGVDTQHLSANKSDTITIDADESSSEFRKYYYEMERYLMENCKSIKNKIATSEVTSNKSLSDDKEAI